MVMREVLEREDDDDEEEDEDEDEDGRSNRGGKEQNE